MIKDDILYDYSKQANSCLTDAKSLLKLHLIRFKHLVDHSDKGFDCTYSRLTARHFNEDIESELLVLMSLRDKLDNLIVGLQNEKTTTN